LTTKPAFGFRKGANYSFAWNLFLLAIRVCGGTHNKRRMTTILYVEDDANDVFFVIRAVRQAFAEASLKIVTSGNEAIAYLTGTGKYSERIYHPLPSLILLDLNMPGMSGAEVLKWVRGTPAVAHIPVVILSSSERKHDKDQTAKFGANAYMVKPSNLDERVPMIQSLRSFWTGHGTPEQARQS
jgi:CheY-like chemotaxis protein